MKNEQTIDLKDTLESQASVPLLISDSLFSIPHLSANCQGSNVSTLACINKNCQQKYPFVCSNIECICQSPHEQCIKSNLRFMTKKLTQKINQSSQIKAEVQTMFDKIIDRVSDIREKILNQIDRNFKYANLNALQFEFLKGMQTNTFPQSLVGQMQDLWKLLTEKKSEKMNCYDILIEKIQELQTTVQQRSIKIQNFVNDKVSRLSKVNLLFKESSLDLNQTLTLEKLEGFFGKSIKTAELMYKASEHNFEVSKFYELCGKEPHLMIVCKTNKNKLIGGYTPLTFKAQNGDAYVSDFNQESFIFSLTNNDKFTMKTTNNAIYRVNGQERVCFGGCQFEICNHANNVNKCRSYSLNYYYQNNNYEMNSKESFERFNGNTDQYFTVSQWEAWKIGFEEK